MSGRKPTQLTPRGWDTRSDHGHGVLTCHYPDGTIRIEHRCKTVGDLTLVTAPALSPGHQVIQAHPLTITPSILCPDCGLHGYITNGTWVDC